MVDKVMIDASMILHPDSLNQLKELAYANKIGELVVSDAFVRMIEASEEHKNSGFFRILADHFAMPETMINEQAIREFIKSDLFTQNFTRFRRTLSYKHDVYQNLIEQTGNEWITQIVFEEWEFLTTNSWLFAKVRAAYDMMVEAGAVAIQVSKETFENTVRKLKEKYHITEDEINLLVQEIKKITNNVSEEISENIDYLIRLTLKKKYGDEISPNDKVRAIAKWVAVGGASASGISPLAIFAANAFLLCDP